MAFTANTVKPVRPLRTLFGGMVPVPVYDFPVLTTSLAVYEGHAFQFIVTPAGTVEECDGTSGQGVPGTGIPVAALTGGGLVGFAVGASTGAPPFPTAAGATSGGLIFTTPSAVTANDPIPENEKVKLALAMPHVVFYGHLADSSGGAEVDYSATDRNDLFKLFAISASITAGDNDVAFLDKSVTTGNACARPINWAYPQGVPVARTTTAQRDPWELTGTGKVNPAVEFIVARSVWSVHV